VLFAFVAAGGDEGHGLFGEVAAVRYGPFVVLFDKDRAGTAQQGFGVREDTYDVGATFDLVVRPLERIRRPQLSPVGLREYGESQQAKCAILVGC